MKNKTRSLMSSVLCAALVITFSTACHNSTSTHMVSSFCDTCELSVLKYIFEVDSVKIFFKDSLESNRPELLHTPIAKSYKVSIETSKYCTDTFVLRYLDTESISSYSRLIVNQPTMSPNNFGDWGTAILDDAIIDTGLRHNTVTNYIRISKPLFSKNRDFVLIEIDYNCFGLCGDGYTYILRKRNKGWELFQKHLRWIS